MKRLWLALFLGWWVSAALAQVPGGGGITIVTDGSTTVQGPYKLQFSGATVTNPAAGNATVTITGGGSGCALTGCTFNAGATVAFAAGAGTTVNTASAQAAAGYFLPFATDAGITVGSTVTGTGIAANTYAIMVSGQTTTTSITMPLTTAAGNDNYAVSTTAGLAVNMAVGDTTTSNALDQTAIITGLWGTATTTANLTTPTASGTTNVITVASGGTSCLKGQIVYDSTTPSALTYPLTYVTANSATTVTLSENIQSTISGTDTVTCYPQMQLTAGSNKNGVTAADTLVAYPAVGLNQLTSTGVGSGTAITFTPPTSSLTALSLSSTGTIGTGWAGLQMNGVTVMQFQNGLSYQNLPGGDVLIGQGCGSSLSAADSLTTCTGYYALNALQVNSSESTAYGQGAGKRSIDGTHLDLFGINALTSCVWGCHDIFAMGTDAMRNAQQITASLAAGSSGLVAATGVNDVAVGIGKVLGGSTTCCYTVNGTTSVGASASSSAGIVSFTDVTNVGAFSFAAGTTLNGATCVGFQCGFLDQTGLVTAVGNNACASVVSNSCTGLGNLALQNATGNNDMAFGPNACDHVTTGTSNLCIGFQVGHVTLLNGSSNILIGLSSTCDVPSGATGSTFRICGTGAAFMSETGTNAPTTGVLTLAGGSLITGIAAASLSTDMAQIAGGSVSLPFAATTGAATGQTVIGLDVPLGTTVASIVSTAQVTFSTTGSSTSGQKVISVNSSPAVATGQQCLDTTAGHTSYIGAGNLIASVNPGTSVTLTANIVTTIPTSDTIKCDPVVTLSAATTASVASGNAMLFTANATAVSASSSFVDQGDVSVYGNLNTAGAVSLAGLTNVTGATQGTVCWSTGGVLSYDGTNTCLVSSARFKHDVHPLTGALSEIDRMRPVSFVYNGDKTDALHFGMIAEEVAKIDPRLVANDNEGRPLQIKYLDAISLLVQGMKEMQGEIDALKRHPLLAK